MGTSYSLSPEGMLNPLRHNGIMIRSAEQRWPMKPEYRAAIVNRLMRIILEPGNSQRDVVRATRALLSIEAQNQADDHKRIPDLIAHVHAMADSQRRSLLIGMLDRHVGGPAAVVPTAG